MTKETNKEIINPEEKEKREEELQAKFKLANGEIQKILEKYELALMPYTETHIANGLNIGTRAKVTFVPMQKDEEPK